MASVLMRLIALLSVTSVRGSLSAGVYRQQLVAVLRTAGSLDADFVDAEAGGAFSVSRDLRTMSIGVNGISCALAMGEDAAADESIWNHSPPCAASVGGYPLGGLLVQGSSVNGDHRLCVGIGVGSAFDHMSDRDAAADDVDQYIVHAPAPHAVNALSTVWRSLNALSEASDGSRSDGAVLAINTPTAGAHEPRNAIASSFCRASRDGHWAPTVGLPSYDCQPSSDGEAGSCYPPPTAGAHGPPTATASSICQLSSDSQVGSFCPPPLCNVSRDTRASSPGSPTISRSLARARLLEPATASSRGGGLIAGLMALFLRMEYSWWRTHWLIRLLVVINAIYSVYSIGYDRGESANELKQPAREKPTCEPTCEPTLQAQPTREQPMCAQSVREHPMHAQPACEQPTRQQRQPSQNCDAQPRQSHNTLGLFTAYVQHDCAGCRWAAELTARDEQAHTRLGMGPKPLHQHCHTCGAIARADHSGSCSACYRAAQQPQGERRTRKPEREESGSFRGRDLDEVQSQIDAISALWHGMDQGATPATVGLDWSVIDQHLSAFTGEEREMLGCLSQLEFDEPESESDATEAELSRLMAASVQRTRGRRRRGRRGGRLGRGQRSRAEQCEPSPPTLRVSVSQQQAVSAPHMSDVERWQESLRAGIPSHECQKWSGTHTEHSASAPAPGSDELEDQWWRMPPVEDPWGEHDRVTAEIWAELHSEPLQLAPAQSELEPGLTLEPEPEYQSGTPDTAQPQPMTPEIGRPRPILPDTVQPIQHPPESEMEHESTPSEPDQLDCLDGSGLYTPDGTAREGYDPMGSSIAQRVVARHRELDPSEPANYQSYSPGGTADAYEPFSTVGARVHARHASALAVDDVGVTRAEDDDAICMV